MWLKPISRCMTTRGKLLFTWPLREVFYQLIQDLEEITRTLLQHEADSKALSHASKTPFDLAPSGSKSRQLLQQRRAEQEKQADKAAKDLLSQTEKTSSSARPRPSPPVPQPTSSAVKSKLQEAVETLCETWTALDLPLDSVANVGLAELSMSQVAGLTYVR